MDELQCLQSEIRKKQEKVSHTKVKTGKEWTGNSNDKYNRNTGNRHIPINNIHL